jgi:putative spermidine/putrescine transport system permease protein
MSSRTSAVERAGLVLFLLLAVFPVLSSLAYDALYGFGLTGLLSSGFTLEHWRRVATSREVWASAGLSFYVAGAVVLATAVLALPLALGLRERLERGWLAPFLAFPLAIPGTVGAVLALQLLSGAGLVSRIVLGLGLGGGIAGFPSLVQDEWLIGVIATHVALAAPFFVFLFADLYRSERMADLLELAATLGATRGQGLARVTVPVLLQAARPSLLLLFVLVLGSFEVPLLLGRQSPQMLSVLTYRKYGLFDLAEKPEAYILALTFSLLVLGLVGAVVRARRPPG